jgi:hypothetical protein
MLCVLYLGLFLIQFTVTFNYSLKQKIQVVQEYYKRGGIQSEARRLLDRKHGFEPDWRPIYSIIKTFETSDWVEKPRFHEYERYVRNPKAISWVLDIVIEAENCSESISVRRISELNNNSRESVRLILREDLCLQPYHSISLLVLSEVDPQLRI